MGRDARAQPGGLQELMLQETAVSWLRVRLACSAPQRSWEETREQFRARIKRCCEDINNALDVVGLCNAFPKRVAAMKEAEGRRLRF